MKEMKFMKAEVNERNEIYDNYESRVK